jgi:hypothetical protein
MNNKSNTVTRREALFSAIHGPVLASLVGAPLISSVEVPAPVPEPEFVPENDYPYFGDEPDSLS